ncbi:L-aminoadipate-semialdehyde dehydrogenase-phosphopantetheinyl transferase [Wickerhamomyces ciferrii]|uniref:holo-[acyl-carrier-protein] synthase n=1 Tax=Wickerhamomyces ciferrii (strain ATCC 14091 / BCRC 22168 / CBS 111 / JCM 3599 / NBRC 0793 / NRRL Y-1031 F-60-10) TaxID=1206466 RepID=K0KGJ3_WICCF|nr:L-aminoadipate-semialdehyde dehydrogenase-phosphopantetheinyl transferase [Wickerhamomyces ciferrii]CCH42101.1 L-aminoadipate-semialdehyde dehydrogenase-phosphopantetheinyl transferase [Wickerhamomyces ciferrii]
MSQENIISSFNEFKRSYGSETVVFYVEIDETWDDDYQVSNAKTALANQLLQRFISCLYLGTTDQSSLVFKQNEYGKPYLVGSDFSFSMSNQQGYTSMVINPNGKEIGIDLASCKDVEKFEQDYLNHFQNIFHENEFKLLEEHTNKDELKLIFTTYWALKESYTKYLGIGLNSDLSSYNFQNVELLPENSNPVQMDDPMIIRHNINWSNSTKLEITNEPQKENIWLTKVTPDIVVSIIGYIPRQPRLIKIPLKSITNYFS